MTFDEAILIEIAQRFRRLEDHLEAADLFHASYVEAMEKRIEKADAAHAAGEITYAAYCGRVNEPMADLAALTELRSDIERALDLCREDMVNMQEAIRAK